MTLARIIALGSAAGLLGACGAHPAPPVAPYHAVSDQGWHLIIDDKHVTYIATGQIPILQARPQVIAGATGDSYQTPRITVNVYRAACAAGGRSYPDRVKVTVDGVQRNGCGGV